MSNRCAIWAAAALLASGGTAMADEPVSGEGRAVQIDVQAQPMIDALNQFATQAGVRIVFYTEVTKGVTAPRLVGTYTPDEALRELLKASDLTYTFKNARTVEIHGARDPGGKPAAQASDAAPDRLRLSQTPVPLGDSRQAASSEEAPVADREKLEEITVRGKPFTDANVDIVRTEDDVQPYYIFKGEEIVQSNVSTVEEFLRQKLTMNATFIANSQKVAEGNNFSQVSLRGLGTDQTLILINGRRVSGRLAVAGYGGEQFDLNSIAPAMIDRIEVLPSSASAIYGGSAVGGVLNVVLKRDFTGGDVRIGLDTPLDSYAPTRTATAAYGWSLFEDRTHVTLNASVRDNDSLLFEDRQRYVRKGYARVLEKAPELRFGPGSPFRLGSTPNISSTDGSELVFDGGTRLGSALTYIPEGTSPGTSMADLRAGLLANAGEQNLVLPQTACGFGGCLLTPFTAEGDALLGIGAIRHKVSDRLELIGEVVFSRNDSRQVNSLMFPDEIPADAPSNPFQQDVVILVPLSLSQGRQIWSSESESLRTVAGFVMDLPNDWRMQGDYTWNRSEYHASRGPFLSFAAPVREAIAAGTLNPFVDTLAFPLDLPAHTPQSVRFAGVSTLADVGLRLSGPFGHLPGGRPNLTFGLGHRKESQPSASVAVGPFGLYTYFPMSQRVASAYVEGLVPLISSSNARPGVRLVELQLAGRVEDFSVDSGTPFRFTLPPDFAVDPNEVRVREKADYRSNNLTAGLRYKPVDSLTLRASYATAFLPPNFPDFLPGIVIPNNLESGIDPRRGGEVVEFNYLTGGNPDIKPMDAETLNLGFLFEPRRWPGVRIGLEWFRIDRKNLIFAPGFQEILDNEALYPDRVTREAAAPGDPYGVGRVTLVDAGLLNAKKVSTEGFDVSIGLTKATAERGTFTLDLLATLIDRFTYQAVLDSPAIDIAGKPYSDGGGGPLKVRANATLGWQRGGWQLGWSAIYFGAYDQYDDPSYLAAQGGAMVSSQLYHNLFAGYRFERQESASGFGKALSDLHVTMGIRNVFNTLPSFDVGSSQTQYASPFGDYRLRSIQFAVGKSF